VYSSRALTLDFCEKGDRERERERVRVVFACACVMMSGYVSPCM